MMTTKPVAPFTAHMAYKATPHRGAHISTLTYRTFKAAENALRVHDVGVVHRSVTDAEGSVVRSIHQRGHPVEMATPRNVTPKAAALAAIAALREHLERVEGYVAAQTDGEDSVPLGFSNEYFVKVVRAGDGLACHAWDTYSDNPQPAPTVAAEGAAQLALQMLRMIATDAVDAASQALVEAGYHHN